MKRSSKLQKKLDEIAAKSQQNKQKVYLEKIKSEIDISGEFLNSDSETLVDLRAAKYVASYKYMENPMLKLRISEIDRLDLYDAFCPYIEKYEFSGKALIFICNEIYGGSWLKVEKEKVLNLICSEIKNSNPRHMFECLVSSTKSEIILGLFEDEYEYSICQFDGKS